MDETNTKESKEAGHLAKSDAEKSRPNPADAFREPQSQAKETFDPLKEGDFAVSKSAWDKKEAFSVTSDDQGRTTRFEGWLGRAGGERSSRDGKIQMEVGGGGGENEHKHEGCHLIAYSLGGANVEQHGAELTRQNMIRGDARMNKSYMGGMETHLRDYMDNNPGKQLYMQADVNYHEDGRAILTHRIFEKDEQGNVSKHSLWEYETRINAQPDQTAADGVKAQTGKPLQEFHTPGQRGTKDLIQ